MKTLFASAAIFAAIAAQPVNAANSDYPLVEMCSIMAPSIIQNVIESRLDGTSKKANRETMKASWVMVMQQARQSGEMQVDDAHFANIMKIVLRVMDVANEYGYLTDLKTTELQQSLASVVLVDCYNQIAEMF